MPAQSCPSPFAGTCYVCSGVVGVHPADWLMVEDAWKH